jgi:hypothetical protein
MSFRARETRYLQKTDFFDLQYLDSRTRDSMRLLSQLIKCRNKDLYKFVAYYLSFRGLPLFSPYLTGLLCLHESKNLKKPTVDGLLMIPDRSHRGLEYYDSRRTPYI